VLSSKLKFEILNLDLKLDFLLFYSYFVIYHFVRRTVTSKLNQVFSVSIDRIAVYYRDVMFAIIYL